MKKFSEYSKPTIMVINITPKKVILTTSITGTWDGSVSDTGSNWGGTDTDESQYGL